MGNKVLKIVSLVFAILSAVTLFLTAVYSLLLDFAEIGAKVFLEWYFNGRFLFDMSALESVYLFSPILDSLLLALVATAAIVLLIVARRGKFLFLPFGFLTKYAFGACLVIPATLIFNFVSNRFGVPTYVEELLSSLIFNEGLGIIIVVLALLAMAVLFVSAILLKKLRFVPMALISLTLGAGSLVALFNSVFLLVANFGAYMQVLEHFQGLMTLYRAYQWFVSPFLGIVPLLLLCIASIFAIVAVLPYKTDDETD